jgi:hypothetical protein
LVWPRQRVHCGNPLVLVCRSETSVEQLGIDYETAKAAQDTIEAVLGELACNHEVGGQRNRYSMCMVKRDIG